MRLLLHLSKFTFDCRTTFIILFQIEFLFRVLSTMNCHYRCGNYLSSIFVDINYMKSLSFLSYVNFAYFLVVWYGCWMCVCSCRFPIRKFHTQAMIPKQKKIFSQNNHFRTIFGQSVTLQFRICIQFSSFLHFCT